MSVAEIAFISDQELLNWSEFGWYPFLSDLGQWMGRWSGCRGYNANAIKVRQSSAKCFSVLIEESTKDEAEIVPKLRTVPVFIPRLVARQPIAQWRGLSIEADRDDRFTGEWQLDPRVCAVLAQIGSRGATTSASGTNIRCVKWRWHQLRSQFVAAPPPFRSVQFS